MVNFIVELLLEELKTKLKVNWEVSKVLKHLMLVDGNRKAEAQEMGNLQVDGKFIRDHFFVKRINYKLLNGPSLTTLRSVS